MAARGKSGLWFGLAVLLPLTAHAGAPVFACRLGASLPAQSVFLVAAFEPATACGPEGAGPWLPGEANFWPAEGVRLRSGPLWPELDFQLPAAPAAGRGERLLLVLDPGHGGSQKGAVGVGGFTEKDFTLAMALELKRQLQEGGQFEVILTRERDEDISLWRRVEMANELEADIFISVHANALSRPEIGGVETFFHSLEATGEEARRVAGYENAPAATRTEVADAVAMILQDIQQAERLRSSAQLAGMVHRRLAKAVDWEDHGVMQADFIVLRGTNMPSVLLELGFVTSARDVELLSRPEARRELAAAVVGGLSEFREILLRKRGRLNQFSSK